VRVAVLDHPSAYPFPPHGYGAQEKWFWTVAHGARLDGADVVLVGPDWRKDLTEDFARLPFRIETTSAAEMKTFENETFDLIVAGHEYTSHAAWRERVDPLGVPTVSYQHRPDFVPNDDAYDKTLRRLYVFTRQMRSRYARWSPGYANGVCFADSEVELPPLRRSDGSLVWASKFHRSKAPHVVAAAAILLGRPIRMYGPVWDKRYMDEHAAVFGHDLVEVLPEIAGQAKLELFSTAACTLYSAAPGYIEAGSAFFSDPMRCGVPVAAQVWDFGSAADAACDPLSGAVGVLDRTYSDDRTAATVLAEMVERAIDLDRETVREIAASRFSPVQQFRQLLTI